MYEGSKNDTSRLSFRLAKLSAGYDSRFMPFFYDAFGILDECSFLRLPEKNNNDLLDVCLKRAEELSGCNLMFSGGVDSTFLLACFKATGVPVNLYNYCPGQNRLIPELKSYVENNFNIVYLKNMIEVCHLEKVFMGSLSDSLFFSTHRVAEEKTCKRIVLSDGSIDFEHDFYDMPFISLQDRMLHKFSFDDIELVLSYAALMDVPLDSNKEIARFLDWSCCIPKYMMQASWGYFVGMESFFNKQCFFDIAYTQYWNCNNANYHDKKLYRDFIGDVLGSDFGVKKNYT